MPVEGGTAGHPAVGTAPYLLLAVLASLKDRPVNTPPAIAATPAMAPPAMSRVLLARLATMATSTSAGCPLVAWTDTEAGGNPSSRASIRWVPAST